jgi:hypothetical protein
MSDQPKKNEVAMWNQVRVKFPAGESVFTRREVEDAIDYVKAVNPRATDGLPDDTYLIINRADLGRGEEMIAGVSRSSIVPHKYMIENDSPKQNLAVLLEKVALFLPEFKRRYCDPQR